MGRRRAKTLIPGTETLPRVDCGECGRPAGLVTGEVVYPHRRDLHRKPFWRCCVCLAYVGCHDGTYKPLGTPCGTATRAARISAHAAFDGLWRRKMARDGLSQQRARGQGYKWLSEQLGIPTHETHIGMFNAAMALRVVEICAPFTRGTK